MTNLFKSLLLTGALCLTMGSSADAAPAWKRPMTYTQPDGRQITVGLRGDEFCHWYEASDGAILLRSDDGYLCYATVNADGQTVASAVKATEVAGRTATESAFAKAQNRRAIFNAFGSRAMAARKAAGSDQPQIFKPSFPTTGTVKGLIILADYQDVKFDPAHTRQAYDDMANKDNYDGPNASRSIRDFFREQSYGKFTPQFDIVGPVTLPHDRKYYGESEKVAEMIVDACDAAKAQGHDFSGYDADGDGNVDFVFVIYAGYGESQGGPAESVWPQKVDLEYATWNTYDGLYLKNAACSCELHGNTGSQMDGIGTFCHEFSHILGLPDVYSTNGGSSFGMSDWDTMDHGIYLDDSKTPAGYTAMDKFSVGWLTPTVLSEPQKDLRLNPLSTSSEAYFIVNSENPAEYFTLENRQLTGCDAALPGHGMIISQIHYVPSLWTSNLVNAPSAGYEHIALIAADNNKSETSFSGDPFPGSKNKTSFTDETTPAAKWHTTEAAVNSPVTNIREENGIIIFDYKDPSAGVAQLATENNFAWTAADGTLSLSNPSQGVVTVASVSGKIVSRSASSWQQLSLPAGLYVIKAYGKAGKVLIR